METKGSIIANDGMLYCYDEKRGNIALVKADPEKFEPVSSFRVPYGKGPYWSHPVIKKWNSLCSSWSIIDGLQHQKIAPYENNNFNPVVLHNSFS
jgi:hypothetical protein